MKHENIITPQEALAEKRIYTHNDKILHGVSGIWRDTYVWEDGTIEGGQHGEFEWKSNQIQNTFATLLAAWCRGEAGYGRINYFAVGSGLSSWDTTPPSQSFDQATLVTEDFRKAVAQVDIVYLDPDTDLPTGGTPDSKIEITVTLDSGEANGTLREFALFGGTATASANSGEMVNWVVHSRIDKDSSLTIQRQIRLTFVEQ